ncbi:MAG: RHS repeat protein [Acidobacteria bacterium]|nr:RHS repeat protein [Acidobacteriota bacterium]
MKQPLERRVWYRYAGHAPTTGRSTSAAGRSPVLTARVLDDGSSQITTATYSASDLVTSQTDAVGRTTTYAYATNGIDLLEMRQARTGGGTGLVQSYGSYVNHRPGTVTDAAGQTTTTTYNTAGQPLTVTNAKSETTTYTYDAVTGDLLTVTGPLTGATTTYAYDGYGRLQTVTEADGYAVTTSYDALNRVTATTYPDGTTETKTYARLDLVAEKDRLGRVTRHFYDGFGRRTATQDPANRTITQVWCDCGSLEALIDANGNRTTWERDVQGRVTREVRADGTTDTHYTYDLAGRLKTVTDPKDQVTTHTYTADDQIASTTYTNAVIATPGVTFTYETDYPRVATMVDGIGTTTYAYTDAGTLGAGQVASVDGPLTDDTITYTYDQLGRVVTRAINGSANSVTWACDALGRVTSEVNLLGTFTYTYDGVMSRLATATYPNGQTSLYSYLPNNQDRRLQTIHHRYPNTSTLSKFDYTYDAVGNILTWRQQADTTSVLWRYGYDAADQLTRAVKHATDTPQTVVQRYAYAYDPGGNRTVEQIDDAVTLSSHDALNRLVAQAPGGPLVVAGTLNEPGTITIGSAPVPVDGSNTFRGTVPTVAGTNTFTITARDAAGNQTVQAYEVDITGTGLTFTYDANGNLASDGTRTFEWDAHNQLVAVTESSQRAEYSYDGMGRRVRIRTLTGGVETGDSQYVWCNGAICEERTGGAVSTRFYSSGVERGGTFYHVRDHLTSIRDITNASGTLQGRLEYDPYGSATVVAGAPVAGLGFGGLRLSDFSGIHLAVYRAYDSRLGRWISQDPIGINGGINLYAYVGNGSTNAIDSSGLVKIPVGGGKSDCDYYKKKCDDSGVCGPKDQYACNAYQRCRDFPDTLINRCVRRCLVMMDQVCEKGVCRIGSHVVCYTSCLKFDVWNIPPSCTNVSFGR